MKIIPSRDKYVGENVKDKVVLSLGCAGLGGNMGEQLTVINQTAKKWYGFDIDEEFFQKNNLPNVFKVDLNQDWEKSFDDVEVVVLTEVLEHLLHPVTALINIRKNYPGRRLIASVPNGNSLGKILLSVFNVKRYIQQEHAHYYMFNPGTIRNVFRDCGYNEITLKPYDLHRMFIPILTLIPNWSQGFIIETIIPEK